MNKIFIILIHFLLYTSMSNAQNFIMSSVALMPGSLSNSTTVYVKSNANCLDVQSGIAVFNGVINKGDFAINCEVNQAFNSLGVKMYPNPVAVLSKVKFSEIPPLNEIFSISVWNTEGVMMILRKESGYAIFQGIMLDVSSLISGNYILKVESTKYIDAIKFIKAN